MPTPDNSTLSIGCVLEFKALTNLGAPTGAATVIARVMDCNLPGFKIEKVDVSDQGANRKRSVGGVEDPQEYEFELVFTGAAWATLNGLKRVPKQWYVKLPPAENSPANSTGPIFDFTGYLVELGGASKYGDKFTTKCKIQIDSEIAFTAQVNGT